MMITIYTYKDYIYPYFDEHTYYVQCAFLFLPLCKTCMNDLKSLILYLNDSFLKITYKQVNKSISLFTFPKKKRFSQQVRFPVIWNNLKSWFMWKQTIEHRHLICYKYIKLKNVHIISCTFLLYFILF